MEYPYYIVPDVEKYRLTDPTSEEARKLSRRIAANVGDYAALRLVLGIDPPEFACFYPDMAISTPSTLDTIDSFLDKFGKDLKPAGYVPEESSQPEPAAPSKSEASKPSSPTTESLSPAKTDSLSTLIKEKRYNEALAFIESQNLIYPQKSIYFAHQISFLKKLIAIENYRNKTMG